MVELLLNLLNVMYISPPNSTTNKICINGMSNRSDLISIKTWFNSKYISVQENADNTENNKGVNICL